MTPREVLSVTRSLRTGASGRTILAYLPEPIQQRVLAEPVPSEAGPGATKDNDQLLRSLQDIRDNGYATGFQECMAGWNSRAAPVMREDSIPVPYSYSSQPTRCRRSTRSSSTPPDEPGLSSPGSPTFSSRDVHRLDPLGSTAIFSTRSTWRTDRALVCLSSNGPVLTTHHRGRRETPAPCCARPQSRARCFCPQLHSRRAFPVPGPQRN